MVDPFYRDVARIALTVAQAHGFVLGGGVAWLVNGLVERPTEDVDLFTDTDIQEFAVSSGHRALRLTLCRLDRHRAPVVMDVGPVMHLDDLVATKVAALVNRREVRDYIDVAAARARYSLDRMLQLACAADPALDPADVADAGRYLDTLDDTRFARYGADPSDVRARFADWPR